jgi:cation transporter-like permease
MAMADAPNAPNKKLRIAGAIVLFGALFAILIAAGWHAVGAWNAMSGAPMPTSAYVAMILGVVFSLVVGCGLMALLFYSSRHGYDDRIEYDDPHEYDDPDQNEHDEQQ